MSSGCCDKTVNGRYMKAIMMSRHFSFDIATDLLLGRALGPGFNSPGLTTWPGYSISFRCRRPVVLALWAQIEAKEMNWGFFTLEVFGLACYSLRCS
jgi:hypothetical protein